MSRSLLVSTVIPVYNRQILVERAVRSVLAQSMADLEVIVVDDGSTDASASHVEALARMDERLRLIRQPNSGSQAARNRGIQAARGDYIAFLDSDDEWLPQKLEKQLAMFNASGNRLGVVYAGFRQVYSDGRPPADALPWARGDIYRAALAGWIADMNTLVVRRDVFAQSGLLDERIRAWQEWALCIRLARHCEFDFVPEPLAIYYLHSGATISKDLLRSAQGYLDVVNLFQQEISFELGKRALASHFCSAGRLFCQAGDFTAGRDCFRQALRSYPNLPKSYVYLAIAMLGAGPYRLAVLINKKLRLASQRNNSRVEG